MTAKELRLWRAAVNLQQAGRLMEAAHDDLYQRGGWPLEVRDIEDLRRKVVEVQLKLSLESWPPGLRED